MGERAPHFVPCAWRLNCRQALMRLIVLFSQGDKCRSDAMKMTSLLYSSQKTSLFFATRTQVHCGGPVTSSGGKL